MDSAVAVMRRRRRATAGVVAAVPESVVFFIGYLLFSRYQPNCRSVNLPQIHGKFPVQNRPAYEPWTGPNNWPPLPCPLLLWGRRGRQIASFGLKLEHFHQSCSAGLRSERRRSFCPWASFRLSYRVCGTCAFAKASPKGKNPRRPALHLFCQCCSPDISQSFHLHKASVRFGKAKRTWSDFSGYDRVPEAVKTAVSLTARVHRAGSPVLMKGKPAAMKYSG